MIIVTNRGLPPSPGCVTASFEKGAYSRDRAWRWLTRHPPIVDGWIPDSGPYSNPYRKEHTATHWAWTIVAWRREGTESAELEPVQNEYDPELWFSTSRRFRTIRRIPEGDPIEQLERLDPEQHARMMRSFRREARSWLVAYHPAEEATLGPAAYRAFRDAGGRPSNA